MSNHIKFERAKTRDEVLAQCKTQGIKVDQKAYERGSDYTTLSKGGCTIVWSSWNGKFMGKTPDGIEFNSDSAKHDNEPWMQALLSFFFVPKQSGSKSCS